MVRAVNCENMRRAVAGDIVASYANGSVGHIGTVIGEAITSPKPDFRSAGTTWSAEGWRLPVRWLPMPTRVRPKNHWSELSELFPQKYSPINKEGNGNQKAYLTEVREKLIQRIAELGGFDLRELGPSRLEEDLARPIHGVRDFAVTFGLPDCGRAAPFGYFAA